MFFVLLLIAAGFVVTTAMKQGPRPAIALAFALSLALPCWAYREIGAIRLDVRTAIALVGIGCVLLHPRTALGWRPLAADFVVLALIVSQFCSEALTSVATLTVAADIVVQWLVPYIFGRIVWTSDADGREILPRVAVVCVVLGVWSVVESLARVNPLGMLFGHVGSLQSMYDLRWGLRRAEGPLTHPIFFGLLFVLLLPFALAARKRALDGDGPNWWRWTPWVVAGGAFFTMSRGPQMGILLAAATAVAWLVPRWRAAIVAPMAIGLVCAVSMSSLLVDLLQHWAGEEVRMNILIRGEQVAYTGTMHRLLQLEVYREAVANAGWLGYGTVALRAEGTKIPHIEEHLRQMFASIDNHYLQFVLQSGFLGLGLFLTLCLLGVGYAASGIAGARPEQRWLAAGMSGSLLALTLLMFSVWLGGDYRFVLFTMFGIAGGLRLSRRRQAATTPLVSSVTIPATAAIDGPLVALRPSPGYSLASFG
jgi:hypothetical protein